MDTRVRAVIAEDEELARASLRRLVSEVEWVELVGEAADGNAAVETIDRLRPELTVFHIAPGLQENLFLQLMECCR